MCELNVLVWNINGNYGLRSYAIPPFIAPTIVRKNEGDKAADIIILTQFIVAPGWCHLKAVLEENGYYIFTSYVSGQNGVLIAINKNTMGLDIMSFESVVSSTKMNTDEVEKPNFLQVTVKYEGKPLTIMGTRIRTRYKIMNQSENQFRIEQFNALYDHLAGYKEQRIICAGDFNPVCSRKNLDINKTKHEKDKSEGKETWGYWWVVDKLKDIPFKIITPVREDGSWVGKNNEMYLNDHIITSSNINVSDEEYNWRFVTKENGYVKVVNDEEVELKKNDYKFHLKGYPDHAILRAKVNL
jgi:exonuclease III